MNVSLYVRVSSGGKRRYVPVNKKKIYRAGTVFCLRYARKWETLTADNLNAALAARALKEAALLTEQPSLLRKAPAKRIGIDDAITVYLVEPPPGSANPPTQAAEHKRVRRSPAGSACRRAGRPEVGRAKAGRSSLCGGFSAGRFAGYFFGP